MAGVIKSRHIYNVMKIIPMGEEIRIAGNSTCRKRLEGGPWAVSKRKKRKMVKMMEPLVESILEKNNCISGMENQYKKKIIISEATEMALEAIQDEKKYLGLIQDEKESLKIWVPSAGALGVLAFLGITNKANPVLFVIASILAAVFLVASISKFAALGKIKRGMGETANRVEQKIIETVSNISKMVE